MSNPTQPSNFASGQGGSAWFEFNGREGRRIVVSQWPTIVRWFQSKLQTFLRGRVTIPSLTRAAPSRRPGNIQADGWFGPETADSFAFLLQLSGAPRAVLDNFLVGWRNGIIAPESVQYLVWLTFFVRSVGTEQAPGAQGTLEVSAIDIPRGAVMPDPRTRVVTNPADDLWVDVYNPETEEYPLAPSQGGSTARYRGGELNSQSSGGPEDSELYWMPETTDPLLGIDDQNQPPNRQEENFQGNKDGSTGWPVWAYILAALAGVAVVGGIAYLFMKKDTKALPSGRMSRREDRRIGVRATS